ncbi:MAG: 2-oxo acid dehydrogenase subunit E2 [Thermaerobacter sp.]|nr:2-oxo acid dehydrogenase subunit E2 [Thermaerobacter sp.]
MDIVTRFSVHADAEAVLTHWLYDDGAAVEVNTVVAEAMTDKVSFEIVSPAAGVLRHKLAEGEAFGPEQVLGSVIVKGAGETARAPFVPAPPAVRRQAAERGWDLTEVARAFPGEPLTMNLLERYKTRVPGGDPPATVGLPPEPLSPFRQALIRTLTDAAALPYTVHRKIRLTGWVMAADRRWLALMARSVQMALGEASTLHGRIDSEGFHPAASLRLGVAVATDEGLTRAVIVPAPDRAAGWDRALHAIRARREAGDAVSPAGASPTFTLSNLGPWGIEYFTPRLSRGEVAILGVGASEPDSAGLVLPLSLTVDHRWVDGVDAAKFLMALAQAAADAASDPDEWE